MQYQMVEVVAVVILVCAFLCVQEGLSPPTPQYSLEQRAARGSPPAVALLPCGDLLLPFLGVRWEHPAPTTMQQGYEVAVQRVILSDP